MAFASLFYYLGLLTTAYFSLKSIQFLHLYFRPSSLVRYRHGVEPWALVTGGSDGIGLGFARELCHKGFNVILLGHKPDELKQAKESLERQSRGVQIKILVANAITISHSDLQEIVESLQDLHITVLINNVGGLPVTHSPFRTLAQFTQQEIDDTISLNTNFMARLTALLLPGLARSGPSLILNVSSGSHIGFPYVLMYSATKGFVSSFTYALANEVKCESLPIEVMAFIPGNVRSGSNRIPLSWAVPSADTYAKEALRSVGCGWVIVPGYWRHALQVIALSSLPQGMQQAALADTMNKIRQTHETMHQD